MYRGAVRVWTSIVAACLCLAVGPRAASAASEDGRFAVERPGQAMCSRFMRARMTNDAEYGRYLGFIEGYLSAASRYEANTFDLTPWHNGPALGLIINKHCTDFPNEPLGIAVQRLVGALLPMRLASYSEMERIQTEQGTVEVYRTILERAQRALAQRGLYSGEANGRYSPQLQTALVDFQRSVGLDPTGVPDTPTLWVILNP